MYIKDILRKDAAVGKYYLPINWCKYSAKYKIYFMTFYILKIYIEKIIKIIFFVCFKADPFSLLLQVIHSINVSHTSTMCHVLF